MQQEAVEVGQSHPNASTNYTRDFGALEGDGNANRPIAQEAMEKFSIEKVRYNPHDTLEAPLI